MSLVNRLTNLFRREDLGRDIDRELAFHISERVDEMVAAGMSEREARQLAHRQFGNFALAKERTHDVNIAGALDRFAQDIRYGLRQLRLNPGFATVAILSLALGIGANTAMFQLLNAVRLRALPVESPEHLAIINFPPGTNRAGDFTSRSASLTFPLYESIRDTQQAFSGVFAWSAERFNLADGGEARPAEGLYVSKDFFRVLGVAPALGRGLSAEDDAGACSSNDVVLSHAFFQREFGGDVAALGKDLKLNGRPFRVAGVTPPSFFGVEVGRSFDVVLPLCADALLADDNRGRRHERDGWWLSMMGRLKPGWTTESASAHLRAISPTVAESTLPPTYRADNAEKYLRNTLEAQPGGTGVSGLRRDYERPLWFLLATTGLVLLIACANLANLLLARASVRQREIAVRQALGASRARVVRQLMAESLLLAALGAIGGTILAHLVSRGLVIFLSRPDAPLFVTLGLDWRVLGFTATVGAATCLLFGLMPAVRATRVAPAAAMRAGGGRGATEGRERFGLRRAMVVAQVALSLALLVSALLFTRSLRNLLATETGFRAENALAASVFLRAADYAPERRVAIYRELLDRVAAEPGVRAVAHASIMPMSGDGWNESVVVDGAAGGAGEVKNTSWFNRVSKDYFKTMSTPLLVGREFDDRDSKNAAPTAIVNQTFVRTFFGDDRQNPVGRNVRVLAEVGKPDQVYQVIGLVADTKYGSLREEQRPIVYVAAAQEEQPGTFATFVVRAEEGRLGDVTTRFKNAAAVVTPSSTLQFRVLDVMIKQSLTRDRLMATLSGGFGLLAALLATFGLYGVMSYDVARRKNEIGIRMALGADGAKIVGLVMREAAYLLVVGLTVGLVITFALTRWAESLLFGLQPNDPLTIGLSVALLSAVAALASFLPASRASRLNPVAALRDE